MPLLLPRIGGAIRHVDYRLPGDRGAVPTGHDQGTEQVDAALQVVLLCVEVDPDQVRVQVRCGHREGAVALAGDVAQSLRAVFTDGAAETLRPVDQLVEPGADGPGGGDLLDLGLPASSR